ncbi:MAG: response regulator [Candidatus Kaelpia imicola]|nr:response regulator [Candidatus Kaelpia imicola]
MAKILMVDDDLEFLEASKRVLEGAGNKVKTLNNIKDAESSVKDEEPDLVLLDIMIEEADDGIALAHKLRREGFQGSIIMLSAVGKVTGFEYGKCDEVLPCNDFLEKPITPQDLIEKVNKYVK